jgi:hypothetical protein
MVNPLIGPSDSTILPHFKKSSGWPVFFFAGQCISRLRNRTLTNREKNCRRGSLRPRQDDLEDVKGLRSLNN